MIAARGVRALSISIARRLNRLFGRKGRFFSDRYHARALKTPREIRNVLCYVLLSSNHHTSHSLSRKREPDFYSSGWVFDGWRERLGVAPEGIPAV